MIRIEPEDFHIDIPEQGGVYWIYSLDNNDVPYPINRILGIDTNGVLYIGESENLRDRLRMLWRVLNPEYLATAHTFGVNYNALPSLQLRFPLNTLAVEYEVNAHHKIYETKLIETYRQTFGEVPPMNGRK